MSKQEKWFRRLQSERAKKPRKRTTLARQAVEYVLRVADMFPGTTGFTEDEHWYKVYRSRMPARGLHLRRFRHYVGGECRLIDGQLDIEITLHEENGKPSEYEFFCNNTFRRELIKDSTIRRIVSEHGKQYEERMSKIGL